MTATLPQQVDATQDALAAVALQHEVEQFLYREAELLDDREYVAWLELLAPDIHYWVPLRRNRTLRDLDQENSGPSEAAHFDDDHTSLGWRVTKLGTGMAWGEDPPSRTRRIVGNVRITPTPDPGEHTVRSNLLLYRNRLEVETDVFACERTDVLRRTDTGFRIARRTVLLDQAVVLSKNISVFL
jgi:3-phenylpropionate/cinnamic acid dioxygenase small subunit